MHGARNSHRRAIGPRSNPQQNEKKVQKKTKKSLTTAPTANINTLASPLSSTKSSPIQNPLLSSYTNHNVPNPTATLKNTLKSPLTTSIRSFGVQRKKSRPNGNVVQKGSRGGGRNQDITMEFDDFASMFEDLEHFDPTMGGSSRSKKGLRSHMPSPMDMEFMGMTSGGGYGSDIFKRGEKIHKNGLKNSKHVHMRGFNEVDLEQMFRDDVFGDDYGVDMSSSEDFQPIGRKGNNKRQHMSFDDVFGDFEGHSRTTTTTTAASKKSSKKQNKQQRRDQEEDDMDNLLFQMFGGDPNSFGFEDVIDDRAEKRQRRQNDKSVNSQRILRTSDGVEVFNDNDHIQEAMSRAEIREAVVVDVDQNDEKKNTSYHSETYKNRSHKNRFDQQAAKNPNQNIGGQMYEAQFESAEDIRSKQRHEASMKRTWATGTKLANGELDPDQNYANIFKDENNPQEYSKYFAQPSSHGFQNAQNAQNFSSKKTTKTTHDENETVGPDGKNVRIVTDSVEVDESGITTDLTGKATFSHVPTQVQYYDGTKDEQFMEMQRRIEESNREYIATQAEREREQFENELYLNPNSPVLEQKMHNDPHYQSKAYKEAQTSPSSLLNSMLGDIADMEDEMRRVEKIEKRSKNLTKDDILSITLDKTAKIGDKTSPNESNNFKKTNTAYGLDGEVNILDEDLTKKMNKANTAYDTASATIHKLHERMVKYNEQVVDKPDAPTFDIDKNMKEIKKEIQLDNARTPDERRVLHNFGNITRHAYATNTKVEEQIEDFHQKFKNDFSSTKSAENIASFIHEAIFDHKLQPKLLSNMIHERYVHVKKYLKSKRDSGKLPMDAYMRKRAELEDLMTQKDDMVALFTSQRDGTPTPQFKSTIVLADLSDSEPVVEKKAQKMENVQNKTEKVQNVAQTEESFNPFQSQRPTLEDLLRKNKNKRDFEVNDVEKLKKGYLSQHGLKSFEDERFDRSIANGSRGKKLSGELRDDLQHLMGPASDNDDEYVNMIKNATHDYEKTLKRGTKNNLIHEEDLNLQNEKYNFDDFEAVYNEGSRNKRKGRNNMNDLGGNNFEQMFEHLNGGESMTKNHHFGSTLGSTFSKTNQFSPENNSPTNNRANQRARKDESNRIHEMYRPSRKFSTVIQKYNSIVHRNGFHNVQDNNNIKTQKNIQLLDNFTNPIQTLQTTFSGMFPVTFSPSTKFNHNNSSPLLTSKRFFTSSLPHSPRSSQNRLFSSSNKPKPGRVSQLVDQDINSANIRLDSLLASPSHRQKQLNNPQLEPTANRKMQQFQRQKIEQEEKALKTHAKQQQIKSAHSALKMSMKDLGDQSHAKGFVEKQLGKINKSNSSSKTAAATEEFYNVPTKQGRKAMREARLKDLGQFQGKHKPKHNVFSDQVNKAIRQSAIRNSDGTSTTFTINANGNIVTKKKHLSGLQRAKAVAVAIRDRSRDFVGKLNGSYPTTYDDALKSSPNVSRPKFPAWMADMDNDPYMLNEHWSEEEQSEEGFDGAAEANKHGNDDENVINSDKMGTKPSKAVKTDEGDDNDVDDVDDDIELGLASDEVKTDRAFSYSKREQDRLVSKTLSQQLHSLGMHDDHDLDLELGPLKHFKTDPMSLISQRKIDLIPEDDSTRFEVLYAKGLIRQQVEKQVQLARDNAGGFKIEGDDFLPVQAGGDEISQKQPKKISILDDIDFDDDNNDDSGADTANESEVERALEKLLNKANAFSIDVTPGFQGSEKVAEKREDERNSTKPIKKANSFLQPGSLDDNDDDDDNEEGSQDDKPLSQSDLINKLTENRFKAAYKKYAEKNAYNNNPTAPTLSYEKQLKLFEEELEKQTIEAKVESGLGYITELEQDPDFIDEDYNKYKKKYRYGDVPVSDNESSPPHGKHRVDGGGGDDNDDDDEFDSDDVNDTNNIYLPKKYMDLHKKGLYSQKSARRKTKEQLAEEKRTQAEWGRDTDVFYDEVELLQMKGFQVEDQDEEQRLSRRLDRYQDVSNKFKPGTVPEAPLAKKKGEMKFSDSNSKFHTDDDFSRQFDNIEDDVLSDYGESGDEAFLEQLVHSGDENDEYSPQLKNALKKGPKKPLNLEDPDCYDDLGFLKPEYQGLSHGMTQLPVNDQDHPQLTPKTHFTTQKNRKDRKNIIDLEEIIENDLSNDEVYQFEDEEEQSYVQGHQTANANAGGGKPQAVAKIIGGESFFTFELHEDDLEEHFVRGSGPGGQSVNKTKNCVVLQHKPTSTVVKCSQTRELHINRAIARKIMKRKLEALFKGKDSYIGRKIERLQRKKQKAARRQKSSEKYSQKRDSEIDRLRAKLGLDKNDDKDDNFDDRSDDSGDSDDGHVEVIPSKQQQQRINKAVAQELNPDFVQKNTKM